jgi:serine/threonine protein phosphatase PrpC
VACDGLWDVFSSSEAVDLVRQLYQEGESDEKKIAEELLDCALEKGASAEYFTYMHI